MDTKRTSIAIAVIILLETILGYLMYRSLPSQMASHWNAAGHVDGYMSTYWSLAIFPILLAFIFALWLVIPRIEPMKKNFDSFRESYNGFFLVLSVFTFYLFSLMLGKGVGWEFDIRVAIAPALALVLASVAVLLPATKRNYFVGIRTPWTLSSDKVWKRTHAIGSKLFYLCAVWAFAGAVYPNYFLWFLTMPLTFTVLVVVIYSYVEFRRLKV